MTPQAATDEGGMTARNDAAGRQGRTPRDGEEWRWRRYKDAGVGKLLESKVDEDNSRRRSSGTENGRRVGKHREEGRIENKDAGVEVDKGGC